MTRETAIVNCAIADNQDWQWLAPKLPQSLNWEFFHCSSRTKSLFSLGTSKSFTCYRCIKHIKDSPTDLLITHDPAITARCGLVQLAYGIDVPHVAFSFNFTTLPKGLKYLAMKRAYQKVSRFVVFSQAEKQLYHEYFGIPLDIIDFIYWGVAPPKIANTAQPLITGDYICAVGGNARDYKTLMLAMEQLPQIPLVLVARPHNLKGLNIPSNVTIKTNISLPDAVNVIKFSKFMVLPLAGSEVPCGHVTIVNAMHLGIPTIITESTGVSDYAIENETALTYQAFSVDDLKEKTLSLWENSSRCQTLGNNAQAFANQHCNEESTIAYSQQLLHDLQLL